MCVWHVIVVDEPQWRWRGWWQDGEEVVVGISWTFVGLLAGLSFICLALHSLMLALGAFAGKARSVLVFQLTGWSHYDCNLWVIVLKWTSFR